MRVGLSLGGLLSGYRGWLLVVTEFLRRCLRMTGWDRLGWIGVWVVLSVLALAEEGGLAGMDKL
ncbi:MAG TPA: hypothetical protein DCR93_39650 [Cytophagales bacterium]|nr:hypothetical protein [Cytophagales bacterium]